MTPGALIDALQLAAQHRRSVLLTEAFPGSGARLVGTALGPERVSVLLVQGLAQESAARQVELWKAVLDTPIFSVVIVGKGERIGVPVIANKLVRLTEEGNERRE